MKTVQNYYKNRFPTSEMAQRGGIWKVLCGDVFQKYVEPSDTVMDIGAGYCEFINNIKCKRKIALDLNPDVKKFADKGVEIINVDVNKVGNKLKNKVDVIFVSNFLEHLNTKEEVIDVLESSYEFLKPGGRILILQPNISLTGVKYWDFIDHKVALNKRSVIEALQIVGFNLTQVTERFLPYTTKSIIPQLPLLVKLYLTTPPVFRPFAGQSFFVATK